MQKEPDEEVGYSLTLVLIRETLMALIWEEGGREESWGMGPLVVCVGGSVVGGRWNEGDLLCRRDVEEVRRKKKKK